jgi:hypothetical protein
LYVILWQRGRLLEHGSRWERGVAGAGEGCESYTEFWCWSSIWVTLMDGSKLIKTQHEMTSAGPMVCQSHGNFDITLLDTSKMNQKLNY